MAKVKVSMTTKSVHNEPKEEKPKEEKPKVKE